MRDLAVALMRVWWVTTATSCRSISQTRLLSQRPRRRTNSASSNWCNKRVAPPGRREARSYGATSADLRVGRPSAACSIENLFLKVLDEKLWRLTAIQLPKSCSQKADYILWIYSRRLMPRRNTTCFWLVNLEQCKWHSWSSFSWQNQISSCGG